MLFRFFELIERLAEEESGDGNSEQGFRTDTPRDPAFTVASVPA